MGEVAEMMLEGILCQYCGEFLGEGNGYPESCGCDGEQEELPVAKGRFVSIKKQSDLDKANNELKTIEFNVADWSTDRAGNPLCRLYMDWKPDNDYSIPERVGTVCCKDKSLKREVSIMIKRLVQEHKKNRKKRLEEISNLISGE